MQVRQKATMKELTSESAATQVDKKTQAGSSESELSLSDDL